MDSDPWADVSSSPQPSSQPGSPERGLKSSLYQTVQPADQSFPTRGPAEASSSTPLSAPVPPPTLDDTAETAFDDFDDFDEPAAAGPSTIDQGGGEDAFGDFGDFEEGDFEGETDTGTVDMLGAETTEGPTIPRDTWRALSLDPFPRIPDLLVQLSSILAPMLLASSSSTLTDEPPRMTGGLSQIMTSESSREAYAQLTTPPILKPLDWTRSRVRRDHLISMGVPVNLDEVDSHRLTALPPLKIVTLPPTPVKSQSINGGANGRHSPSRKGKGRDLSPAGATLRPSSMPATSTVNGDGVMDAERKYGLGTKPEFDMIQAEELCGLEEDQLSILPPERLRRLQSQLVSTTAQASISLAWYLQLKDAQTQDSNTYNGMISELIANAAKVKSAQSGGSGGVFRRASGRRPTSQSGSTTPRRIASPAMR